MISSRSDGVTRFVCPFVMKKFFIHQKSFNGVFKKMKGCLMKLMILGRLNGDSREFDGCFRSFSKKFFGFFKEVANVIKGSFETDSRKCQLCLCSRKFKWCFKDVLKVFQGRLRGIPKVL